MAEEDVDNNTAVRGETASSDLERDGDTPSQLLENPVAGGTATSSDTGKGESSGSDGSAVVDEPGLFNEPMFSDRFLREHAGQIMSDGRIALLELIANSYDAGARRIEITWPEERGGSFSVSDNGIGMTEDELKLRWSTLSYDRAKHQGDDVIFPKGTAASVRRRALGQHGKGRHAPFCFDDRYTVRTAKADVVIREGKDGKKVRDEPGDGREVCIEVTLDSVNSHPFSLRVLGQGEASTRGTTVEGTVTRHHVTVDDVRRLVGSKFLVDPSLEIVVNDERVELLELDGIEKHRVPFGDGDELEVVKVDSMHTTKTIDLRGITWWVNGRMVGGHSWSRLNGEGTYIDGRSELAKKLSFVVLADSLKSSVKPDWSDLRASDSVISARDALHDYVIRELNDLQGEVRQARKQAAVAEHRDEIKKLPRLSKKIVSQFIDDVQERCPTLSADDLKRTVGVLAGLENSRSGYDLLTRLSDCSPDDLDTWNDVMSRWTASSAAVIFNELDRRLTLINQMEKLVESKLADELHDLQPLFERGLWIFGPEYEAVDFRSNRTLATAVQEFLGPSESTVETPAKRPDFVVLPDDDVLLTPNGSVGFYGADEYDDNGEVVGLRRLLVLELKKGGFPLTRTEIGQAKDYCVQLLEAGRVTDSTQVTAYVLGASLKGRVEPEKFGSNDSIQIVPLVYERVLSRAKTRTFNLQKKLKAAGADLGPPPDIEEILAKETQLPLDAEQDE